MGDLKQAPVFIPYKLEEVAVHSYYQVPKELFANPLYKENLSSDSKLLYSLLLNRLTLSMKNRWIDEDGNIYLIFPRKEAEEKLNLSKNTITKAFKELATTNLISEKRLGRAKSNVIYVGKINHISLLGDDESTENTNNSLNPKNWESRIPEFGNQESQNLGVNNNKYKYNNYNNKYARARKKDFQRYHNNQYDNLDYNKFYTNLDVDFSNKYYDTDNPGQYSEENLRKLGLIV